MEVANCVFGLQPSQSKVSFSKSMEELHQRLAQTEQSLTGLEKISIKSEKIRDSQSGDETPVMPPLTLEELMQESSLQHSFASNFAVADQAAGNVCLKRDRIRMPLPRRASSPVKTVQTSSNSVSSEHNLLDVIGNISEVALDSSAPATLIHEQNHSFSLTSGRPRQKSEQQIFDESTANKSASLRFAFDIHPGDASSDASVSRDVSPQRPISARSNATSVTLVAADADADEAKDHFSSVFADNARLRTLVTQLRSQLALRAESDENPARRVDQTAVRYLKEKLECLTDEVKANARALRKSEEELERREQICAEKDHVLQEFRKEILHLRQLLQHEKTAVISVQAERDDALNNASSSVLKLREFQATMSAQFNESQRFLKNDLARLAEDRASLAAELKLTKSSNSELAARLREVQCKQAALESKNRTQEVEVAKTLDQAQERIRELVAELEAKHKKLKACTAEINNLTSSQKALKSDMKELKHQNELQRDRLQASQSENEIYKSRLSKLEQTLASTERRRKQAVDLALEESAVAAAPPQRDVLSEVTNHSLKDSLRNSAHFASLESSPRKHRSAMIEMDMKLAAKEAHIKRLEARLAGYAAESEKLEGIQTELLDVVEKSRLGDRRCTQLEEIVHSLEDDKSRLAKQVSELEDSLHDKVSECESLEERLTERTSNLSKTQADLEAASKKSSHLAEALKSVNEELASIRDDWTNKVKEAENLTEQLAECEQSLRDQSRRLEQAVESASSKDNERCREIKRLKKVHCEQAQELMDQAQELAQDRDRHASKASSLAKENAVLNDALLNATNQIHYLEQRLKSIEAENAMNQKTQEEALKILEQKATSSSGQVMSLEDALAQCKSEISVYIEQLNQTQDNFRRELAVKEDKVTKLETEVKLVNCSIVEESKRCADLENALNERHKMLEEAASRISDLEESQQSLQTKVAQQEQRLAKELAEKRDLVREMDVKLHKACRALDKKNRDFAQLNEALRQVENDFNECRAEMVAVESHVTELNDEKTETTQELEKTRFEWTEMKAKLDKKIEEIASFEDKLSALDREYRKCQERCIDLETEMTQAESDVKVAKEQNAALEKSIDEQQVEIQSKEATIRSLHDALRLAESEQKKRCDDVVALERALDERQRQLQGRVAQLSQLDEQVREFRRGAEKRSAGLEKRLEESERQLQERNAQVGQLDERLSSMRDDIAEARHVIAEHQQVVRKLEKDLEMREARIEELEKLASAEHGAREEQHKQCLETSQELRYVRECERSTSKQYQESRRDVVRLSKELEQARTDLEQTRKDNCAKDERLSKLGKQLMAVDVEKAVLETRYQEEMDKTHRNVRDICERHETELKALQATNAGLAAKVRAQSGDQSESNDATQRHVEQELERAKGSAVALERELLARKQVIEAANDTIIVKDAEIARLQAKLSGLERDAFLTPLPGNTPVKQLKGNFIEHRLATAGSCLGSVNQAWCSSCKDDDSASLYTGADSDFDSLAPSFVPIAASTKRLEKTREDARRSLFFVTSSPTKHGDPIRDSAQLKEEDSLYRRVFADTTRADFPSALASSRDDDTLDLPLTPQLRGSTSSHSLGLDEMNPDNCMAELQEKLRASEKRRRDVTSKLQVLKSTGG